MHISCLNLKTGQKVEKIHLTLLMGKQLGGFSLYTWKDGTTKRGKVYESVVHLNLHVCSCHYTMWYATDMGRTFTGPHIRSASSDQICPCWFSWELGCKCCLHLKAEQQTGRRYVSSNKHIKQCEVKERWTYHTLKWLYKRSYEWEANN